MPLRSYDPTIARWNRIDPVTHHSLSTYNGFDNNPIYYADPSGGNGQSYRGGHGARLQRMRDNYFGSEYSNLDNFVGRVNDHSTTFDDNNNRPGVVYQATNYGNDLVAALKDLGARYSIIFEQDLNHNISQEQWNNWDDNITVNKDGIVTNVEKNNQADRFFDEDGNELCFNDPDIDFEIINQWLEGDRLFFNISNPELLKAILKQGGLNPLLLRSTGNATGAWVAAALTSHSGADFTFSHLVSKYFTSTERKNLDTGFLRASYQTNFHFFRFGNTNEIYNLYDAGNYMWGSWMNLNGFSPAAIKFGSQVNELRKLGIDSEADQRAIINGFNHF